MTPFKKKKKRKPRGLLQAQFIPDPQAPIPPQDPPEAPTHTPAQGAKQQLTLFKHRKTRMNN